MAATTAAAAATYTAVSSRAATIAQAPPANARALHAVALAFEKTCLSAAIPRRHATNTPITNAARSAACQTGVIRRFITACATMDGTNDRVLTNTTPQPDRHDEKARNHACAMRVRHQILGVRKGEKASRSNDRRPVPQSSESRRRQYPLKKSSSSTGTNAQLITPENAQNSHLRQDISNSACRHGAVALGCREFTRLRAKCRAIPRTPQPRARPEAASSRSAPPG